MDARGRLDDVAPPRAPLRARAFVTHRRSHAGGASPPAADTLERRRSASNLTGTGRGRGTETGTGTGGGGGDLDDALRAGEAVRALRARDDVAALVDFLRNHPPPPGNFMSSPYGADGGEEEEDDDDDERGRWSRLRKLGRRSKSAPRAPRTIRLPDSAVSGVTIGGHRHIAISIPLRASPSGESMRSQYPVYPPQDLSMGAPSAAPVRIRTTDKGVVTVLRPVSEASEASTTRPPPVQPRSPRPGGQSPRAGSAKAPHDYIGILPTRFDTPLLDDAAAPWNRAPERGEGAARGGQSPGVFRRSAYPARSSSMTAGRGAHHPASIDGLIAQPEPRRGAACCPPHGNAPRPPASGAVPDKPAPTAVGGPPATVAGPDDTGPRLTVISDSPIVSRRADSPPPPGGSPKSRRDIVRDKKRRDVEAMRSAQQQKTQPKPADQPNEDTRGRAERSGNDEPAPKLAMSGVMVVVDMQPCPSLEERPSPPRRDSSGPRPDPSGAPRPAHDPNMPTPPVSPRGSPPQSHDAMDRTSLARRREWRALRERERRARDAVASAPARAEPAPPSCGGSGGGGGTVPHADWAAMGLCEAYREHRLLDVERRLRRLERNRDVWTKALVPVLEGVRRTVAAAHEQPPDGRRVPEEPRGPEDPRDDDTSGLGAIEPLMRELAGEARRWRSLRTARTLAICDEGGRHVERAIGL